MPENTFIAPADPLLRALAPLIDADMLGEMASADYGDRTADHLAALVAIHARASVPAAMDWVPQEVLDLIRWSIPEDPAWRPGGQGRRGHLMRAFACAALLSGARSAENRRRSLGYTDTMVQLIGSIAALNLPLHAPAIAQLDAILADGNEDDFGPTETMLLLFGKIALAGQQRAPDLTAITSALDDIETVVADHARNPYPWPQGPMPTLTNVGIKPDAWRALAIHLDETLPARVPEPIAQRLRRVTTAIATAP